VQAGPHRHIYDADITHPPVVDANGTMYVFFNNSLYILSRGEMILFREDIVKGYSIVKVHSTSYFSGVKIVRNTIFFVSQNKANSNSYHLHKIDLATEVPRVENVTYQHAQKRLDVDHDVLHFFDEKKGICHWLYLDGREESVKVENSGFVYNWVAHWPYITLASRPSKFGNPEFLRVSVGKGVQQWGGPQGLFLKMNAGNWGVMNNHLYVVEKFGQFENKGIVRVSQIKFERVKSVVVTDLWASVGVHYDDARTMLYEDNMLHFFGDDRILIHRGGGLLEVKQYSLPWRPGPLRLRR
jgi:hypothetical protein